MIKQFGMTTIDLSNHSVSRGNQHGSGQWQSGYNRHNRQGFVRALQYVEATKQESAAALAAFDSGELYRERESERFDSRANFNVWKDGEEKISIVASNMNAALDAAAEQFGFIDYADMAQAHEWGDGDGLNIELAK